MSQAKTKTKYVSKGERQSINSDLAKAVRRDRSVIDKEKHKLKAWQKGQNPWISVFNPDPTQTKKRKIRVRANDEWGDPRGFDKVLNQTGN